MYAATQQTWTDSARLAHQDARFAELAGLLNRQNRFYQGKWRGLKPEALTQKRLRELPFTVRSELL